MREICTSGSVRDGGGNVPIYSAVDASHGVEVGRKGSRLGQSSEIAGETQGTGVEGCRQTFEKKCAK